MIRAWEDIKIEYEKSIRRRQQNARVWKEKKRRKVEYDCMILEYDITHQTCGQVWCCRFLSCIAGSGSRRCTKGCRSTMTWTRSRFFLFLCFIKLELRFIVNVNIPWDVKYFCDIEFRIFIENYDIPLDILIKKYGSL